MDWLKTLERTAQMGGRYDWCQLLRCIDSSGASWRTPGRGCCSIGSGGKVACGRGGHGRHG